jgi:hypothetical protein
MTVVEMEKAERKFKRRSKAFKWIRRHISKRIGRWLIDWNYDQWAMLYR